MKIPVALALVPALVLSCSGEKTASPVKRSGVAVAPAAVQQFAPALDAYEQMRAALAADRSTGIAEAAKKVKATAGSLAASVDPTLQPHLNHIVQAAEPLVTPPADIEQVRLRFGDLSRHFVLLLGAAPDLAGSRHVMECPMAKGYRKWVQNDATVDNPYMGGRMLRCGFESTWDDKIQQ